MKILFLENDFASRLWIESHLCSLGHEVISCTDTGSAFASFQEKNQPLIIVDPELYDATIKDFCRQIRQLPNGQKCTLWGILSEQTPELLQILLDMGIDDYLSKPVNPTLLKMRLMILEQQLGKIRRITGRTIPLETHIPADDGFCKDEKCFRLKLGKIRRITGRTIPLETHIPADDGFCKDEKCFRLIIKNLPVFIAAMNENGNLIFWNNECENLTGFAAKEMLSNPNAFPLLFPDQVYRQTVLEAWANEEHSLKNREVEITCKDGTKKIIVWSNISRYITNAPWKSWIIGVDVTERKRTESALQKSKDRYRHLVENMPLGMISTDAQGNILDVNRSFLKILDSPPIEAVRATNIFAFPPLMNTDIIRDVHFCLESREPLVSEALYTTRLKKQCYLRCHLVPIFDVHDQNIISGLQATVEDITEHKRVEEILRGAEKYAENIIESSLDMIIATDTENRIIEFNKAAQRAFGYRVEEILGKPIKMLYADTIEAYEVAQMTAEQGQCVREIFYKRKNGKFFPCFLSASILRDAHGESMGVMGISRDITERKRLEEAFRTLMEKIDKAKQEWESTVDSFPELICLVNKEGYVIRANQTLETWNIGHFSEVGQRKLHDFIHPDCVDTSCYFNSLWQQAWENVDYCQSVEHEAYDEMLGHYVLARIRPLQKNIPKRNNDFAVVIVQDITEKKRLESIAEAVNTMENIGYVFSSIRHEIGNPINSIKITISVLKHNLERYSHETILEYIERALTEIARVEYLLKSLKSFSMFETPTIQDVNITEFFHRFLPLISSDFARKGITIDAGGLPENSWVRADPRALHQVMLNLLTNASDALQHQEKPYITIRSSKDEHLTCVYVEDNGCGMTEQQQQDLFKPFYTSKPHGTGLGLVISKKLLAKMDCTIEIDSHKNEGTTAIIALPSSSMSS